MTTFEKTIGNAEHKFGYLNLTSDNGTTYGQNFPMPLTKLIVVTESRQYLATMNNNPNQIWGGLRRWFKDENIYPGDKVRITYDPAKENIDGRSPVEISLLQRAEITEANPNILIEDEQE